MRRFAVAAAVAVVVSGGLAACGTTSSSGGHVAANSCSKAGLRHLLYHKGVLTVATDSGDYILDNQNMNILLWSETGYRFVKRQSQSSPNVWVSLGGQHPTIATATSH